MGRALSFEADRLVLGVTANTCTMKDLLPEDRKKLFPNFGTLVDVHDELAAVNEPSQIPERLKASFPEFAELFDDGRAVGDSAKKSIEKKLAERAIAVYRDCMGTQFQYGVYYGWIKLKEAEIGNLMWISECITQNMKNRVNEFTPVA
eukprot:TRINITY_DN9229_c0_g1_i1.p2 TRINITY_DN9229_c0_g1~~TRINITY_DN9229_c0_g1_i1.p2  ORF type:complete len:148 (-),score=15.16 TRINITY_DN9229_c0_g1_i1:147-590(-)